MDGKSPELASALERLDEVEKDEAFPGKSLIGEAIDETVTDLEKTGGEEGVLSKRWAQLAESLEEWENDHPKITMVVGEFARALAVSGL